MNQKEQVAFLGLGLIGGSIAKAMRKLSDRFSIMAYNPHEDKVRIAREEGVIDVILSDVDDERIGTADWIFLCAPVQKNRENLRRIAPLISSSAIVTDIGSVKTDIHEEACALGIEHSFVGGHPMAGSERTGYFASKEHLLENAYYIITASEYADTDRVDRMVRLVTELGALPIRMDYREHDRIVAAVSHVPHVIAASLVHLVEDNDTEEALMKTIAAGGFKDITRIASSSPVMWEQICLTNGENISGLLDKYIASLKNIQQSIKNRQGQEINAFFAGARDYRDSFTETASGPIRRVHDLHIDIKDEPGVIASVATLLAVHTINIRNIGVTHNREIERGALRIELETAEDTETAREILTSHGYFVS